MHLRSIAVAFLVLAVAGTPLFAKEPFDHTHAEFDRLLQSHVRNGLVDYEGLATSGKLLRRYINRLGSVSENEYGRFTRDEKLAYWLNLYNACILDAVSRNLPEKNADGTPRSPRQIKGLWTVNKWRTPFGTRTLNSMEFDFLRKFKRSLWMLALNRATAGGGQVNEHAFSGTDTAKQVDATARKWLAKPENFLVDPQSKEMRVSQYLLNYFGDLKARYNTHGQFLGRSDKEIVFSNLYLEIGADDATKATLRKGDSMLVELPIDQALNELSVK